MDTSSLHTAASTIRTETQESANTAERVGSCLDSIVTAIDELSTTTASSTRDGLMSSATYNTLDTQVQRITDIAATIPTPQSTPDGGSKQYVYSDSTTNNHSVLCGDFKVFQNSGDCLLRFAIWGGDTSNSGKYITRTIPLANTSGSGLFDKEYLKRLRNATLTESADTSTTEVKITYPDYANGATKTLTLTSASSAKAGILTSATYGTIMTTVQRCADLSDQIKALAARVAALEAKA